MRVAAGPAGEGVAGPADRLDEPARPSPKWEFSDTVLSTQRLLGGSGYGLAGTPPAGIGRR